ncbi:unnamed protein product [Allacma fusca]|uniref:Uncharacterized protein n=1 Tax=Allacma fusca TaxID=39272 RepID=A0A8J2JSR6_9HEXA|nr:unnamed protein product [Allacma fusca]
MNRKLRTLVPSAPKNLEPKLVNSENLEEREALRKERQKVNYDRRHGVREHETLQAGDTVWIKDVKTWGQIEEKASTPWSFIVKTPRGPLRRNSFHLVKVETG